MGLWRVPLLLLLSGVVVSDAGPEWGAQQSSKGQEGGVCGVHGDEGEAVLSSPMRSSMSSTTTGDDLRQRMEQ